MYLKVNIGCGRTPTEGWENFDNSPAIKLAGSPFKYKLARGLGLLNEQQVQNIEWNKANKIRYANAARKIPLEDGSCECVYTSHMVEHLSRSGVLVFISEALRVLSVGGILRVSVPDLNYHIQEYLKDEDADSFMESILVEAPSIDSVRAIVQLLISGYRHHQWMYDGPSLAKLLLNSGFSEVKICSAGETMIIDPSGLNLYERSSNSVYVEGRK